MLALHAFTAEERALFWRLGALSFLLLGSYGVAQPTCQSLFISAHGSAGLPWAWLGVTAVSVVSVVAVGRLSARLPLWRVLRIGSVASALSLVGVLVADAAQVPFAIFVLYIWKDVYIVVLVELFWTFANLAFAQEQARTTYGWFCATGTIGGMAGGFFAANMATRWGTHHVLWTTVPFLLLSAVLASGARQRPAGGRPAADEAAAAPSPRARPAWAEAPAFLRANPFVGWLILLVGVVQATMTVMDFQFNHAADLFTHDTDAMTRLMGQVQGGINVASLLLQVVTGPILRVFGLAGTLLAIPMALMGTLVAFVFVPGMTPIIAAKVVGKSADYSLFRAAKEMLYIPLTYAEKTFGKALVDILVYRVAKGGVSLVLLALVALGRSHATAWVSLVLCAVWIWVTVRLLRRFRRLPGVDGAAGGATGWLLAWAVGATVWGAAPPAAQATGEDPTGVGPSFTKPDLFVHPPGTDLSGQRIDCEVFGWNTAFSEMAAVGSDIARGPRGHHRGEVYMLVTRVADGKILHNVITHNVTHPDLPDNPIPLDDVRDLTWTIEAPFLAMWPVRPQHSRPRDGMAVSALWATVPGGGDHAGDCTPYIGAGLHWRGVHRLFNFRPADMRVSCSVLRQADSRVYWARDDLAVAMTRFDYNNLPQNEKSARFAQALAWPQAVVPHITLEGEIHSPQGLAEVLGAMPWAEVDHHALKVGNPLARALLRVDTSGDGVGLAHHLRATLLGGPAQVPAQVRVHKSRTPPPAAPAQEVGAVGAGSAAPHRVTLAGRRAGRGARGGRGASRRHAAALAPPVGPTLTLLIGDPSWRPPPPPDPDHPNRPRDDDGEARPAPPRRPTTQGDFIDDWMPP